MDDQDAQSLESRPPSPDDLVALCRSLNAEDARYIVIGGMAMAQHGFIRTTLDVDLLIADDEENIRRVLKALESLPDKAVRQITPTELHQYQVIRIADEFVVDIMLSAGGIRYDEAEDERMMTEIDGVSIPFASMELMFRFTQTFREKDSADLLFLKERLGK